MEAFLGFVYGIAVSSLVWFVIVLTAFAPVSREEQFRHDCKVMAHGTVSGRLCVKGNTILFHQ